LRTETTGLAGFRLRADAPWIRLSRTTGTISASSPATVGISVDAAQMGAPGEYTSTVAILSGAAAPRYINVSVTVTTDRSNVAVSISPDPVRKTDGFWSFTVKLAESAGAATRISGLKVNGDDYSSYISAWFGTDVLPAKGVLEAPLSTSGGFPTGLQYFEFWGVDDASGRHWYRVATVDFQ
jgi:hypothetical protein